MIKVGLWEIVLINETISLDILIEWENFFMIFRQRKELLYTKFD